MKGCLTPDIPYVDRLSAECPLMLEMFTGIKHLILHPRFIRLDMFNENIWKNLESLEIYFEGSVDGIGRILSPEDVLEIESKFVMSRLRSLRIHDSDRSYSNVRMSIRLFT